MKDKNQNHIVEPNKKISSVEYYRIHLHALVTFGDTPHKTEEEIFEQAKQMHREEIIEFTDNYVDNCVIPNENMAIPTIMDVPQYYNDTYVE